MLRTSTTILLSLMFANAALAQDDPTTRSHDQSAPPSTQSAAPSAASQPVSRDQVIADTRDAMRSGAIARGQGATPNATGPTPPAAVSRADVKRDAVQAEKDRQPIYGLTSVWNRAAGKSEIDRASVKQETKVAVRYQQVPRGESSPLPNASPAAN